MYPLLLVITSSFTLTINQDINIPKNSPLRMSHPHNKNVILIGNSPSILTSALYVATANNHPIVFLTESGKMINYEKIAGSGKSECDFRLSMVAQLRRFNVDVMYCEDIDHSNSSNKYHNNCNINCNSDCNNKHNNNCNIKSNNKYNTHTTTNTINIHYNTNTNTYTVNNIQSHALVIDTYNTIKYNLSHLINTTNSLFITDNDIKEAILSVGDGCRKGMSVNWYLERECN